MEQFVRHSAISIKPMFGIAPEALYAVYMVFSFRFALYFFDYDMVAMDSQ